MAVSEKYVTFSKLSKDKGGLLAKPFNIEGGTYYSFEVSSTSCDGSSPFTLYSDSETLIVGSVLYTDTSLSLRYGDNSVVYHDGSSYSISTSGGNIGEITNITVCYTTYEGHENCELITPRTVYVAYGAFLITGEILYYDTLLTDPLSITTFIYEGLVYTTDSDGAIIDITSCSPELFLITAYTACDLTIELPLYVADAGTPFVIGTRVFTDELGTEFTGTSFVYEGHEYTDYIVGSGVQNINLCGS